jgi:hypothetical protein
MSDEISDLVEYYSRLQFRLIDEFPEQWKQFEAEYRASGLTTLYLIESERDTTLFWRILPAYDHAILWYPKEGSLPSTKEPQHESF